ncbi:MAG TPA: cytochrome c oxidase subunit II [Pyrinomonadaceae bacterium]|nr:cytochrome c oxidase subunit II [Pyrinomonadaceae bacterium]
MGARRGQWIRYSNFALILYSFLLAHAAPQSVDDPAGPQAGRIDGLWRLMLYLLSAIFIVVMIVLAVAAFRRRDRGPDNAIVPSEPNQEKRISRTVTGSVIVTAVILFGLLVSSFLVGRAIYLTPDKTNVMTIEVNAHQWWWDVRYNNPAPSQIVTTANEIHIPVGRPIAFRLNSMDVIHSFWVPNLHGKTDMIPGRTVETWLQADRPGVYRGQCAEFCGHQHAHMALLIIAEPEEQFRAWYQGQLQSAPAPTTLSQIQGQQIFLSRPCVMCHRIQGTDAGGRVGPDLTHVASRQTIAAGTLQNTREHLSRWIVNSQDIKPGNRMPPIPISGDELNALLDYVQSLK